MGKKRRKTEQQKYKDRSLPNEQKGRKGNHDLKWSPPFNYQPKFRALATLFSRHPRVRCVILFYSIIVRVRNNTQSIDSNRKQTEHRFKHIDISSVNGFELQNEQSIDSNRKHT